MTKQNSKIYLAFIAIALFVAYLIVAIPMFANKDITASADSVSNYIEEITISNGDFSSTTSSTGVLTPSNWTVVDSTNSSKVKAGVINTTPSTFSTNSERYGLDKNPSTPATVQGSNDPYVLMINAEENTLSYGYSSSSISLDANSYYIISFYAKVATNDVKVASAYLVSSDIENSVSNSFINTINDTSWQQYSFYVATGTKSISVNLQLFLGSKSGTFNSTGAVFFDTCKMAKYAESTFMNLAPSYSSTTAKAIDLREEINYANQFENSSFEEDLASSWTRISSQNGQNTYAGITTLDKATFDFDSTHIPTTASLGTNLTTAFNIAGFMPNTKALYINNVAESSTGYRSSSFTFERMKTYKVSVWAKTGKLSSNGASIILKQVVGDDETADFESKFTAVDTSSYTNAISNDWAKYTFFVQGSPYSDIDLELQLWLGSSTETTRGYAFFDEVRVTEIANSEYTSASEGTYIKKLNLSSISGSLNIANGTFNLVEGESEIAGIYTPSNWTYKSNNSTLTSDYSGIINTKTQYFDAITSSTGLVSAQNPGILPNANASLTVADVSNNILMIRNKANGSQYYESESFTLDASKSYNLSLYAYSLSTNARIIVVDSNNNVLAKFENINENEWKQYQVGIKTGIASTTAKIQLWLGSESNQVAGYAFFDNVLLNETQNDIYELGTTKYSRIVDFEQDNFQNTDFNATNGIYTAYLWTASGDNSVISGILDANNQNLVNYNINPSDSTKSNVLFIYSANDVNYSLTSKLSYSFAEESYYKVVVRLKAFDLSQEENHAQKDSDGKVIPYGVYLSLKDVDENFKAISTQTNTSNDWTDYTFVISTGAKALNTQIIISLGNEKALTSGFVAIESVIVSSTDSLEYEEATASLEKAYPPKNIIAVEVAESESQDEEKSEEETTPSTRNFGLIDMATILLALAIVIAIIGVIVRKVAKNKKKTVKIENDYDRNQDNLDRKKITKLENRIKELKQVIASMDEELTEMKAGIFELQEIASTSSKEELPKVNKQLAKENERYELAQNNLSAVKEELTATQEALDAERGSTIEKTRK